MKELSDTDAELKKSVLLKKGVYEDKSEILGINNMLRNTIFENRPFRTKKYGIESLTYLAPMFWSLVPEDIKICATFFVFIFLLFFTS